MKQINTETVTRCFIEAGLGQRDDIDTLVKQRKHSNNPHTDLAEHPTFIAIAISTHKNCESVMELMRTS